jgi:hypothetical protein
MDDDLRTVVERELLLLEPDVRRDAERVRALLSPDFVEFGSSGRVWDRDSVPAATADAAERIAATDLRPRRLGPDAVLLTYRTTTPGRTALRSSTWIRGADRQWLMVFHQGTVVPQGTPVG